MTYFYRESINRWSWPERLFSISDSKTLVCGGKWNSNLEISSEARWVFVSNSYFFWNWNWDWNWNYSILIINNSLALISFPSVLLCFVSDFTTTGYVKITSLRQIIEAQLFFSNMFQYFLKWFGVGPLKAIMHFFFSLLGSCSVFIIYICFMISKIEAWTFYFSSLNGSYLECQCVRERERDLMTNYSNEIIGTELICWLYGFPFVKLD